MIAPQDFRGSRVRCALVVLLAASGWSLGSAHAQEAKTRSATARVKMTAKIGPATAGVKVTWNDLSKVVLAKRGMYIPDGSELTGDSTKDHMQVECANGVSYTLLGKFDVIVDSEDAKPLADPEDPTHRRVMCTVSLKSGTAVATTGVGAGAGSQPGPAAIIGPGAVAMISHHTQFGLSVSNRGAADIVRAFVLDGAAILTSKEKPLEVSAGSSVDPKTNGTKPIDNRTYAEMADAYAELDWSTVAAQGGGVDEEQLQQRWLDALEHFNDPLARVRLSETQAAVGATQSVIFYYELQRAEQLANVSGNRDLIERVRVLRAKFGDFTAAPPGPSPGAGPGASSAPPSPPSLPATLAPAPGAAIRTATADVEVTAADLSKLGEATRGMAIPDGSELTGDSPDDRVQLECGSDISYTLAGPFDVVVDSKDARRLADSRDPRHQGIKCAVELKAGTAIATTWTGEGAGSNGDSAAIIGPGDVVLIADHAQFGLSVPRQGAADLESAFVLDGEAVLTRKDASQEVSAGSSVDPQSNSAGALDDQTYAKIADIYTNLDLSEGAAQGNEAYKDGLQQRWIDALQHFDAAAVRVGLVETEAAAGAAQSVIFYYELLRAEQLANPSGNQELIQRVQVLRADYGTRPPGPGPVLPDAPRLSVS